MDKKNFIFIAGLHRSGTSLLYKSILQHPDITGFKNTGVPEDEGQHLQNVYKTAKAFGGPGEFAFNIKSYMNENHLLATKTNAIKLFKQWSPYLDLSKEYILEKSPPNIIRTRFLQKLFPDSKFIIILRHPLAVSYATKRWSDGSTLELLEHYLLAYETFFEDMKLLQNVYILKYEDFILAPQESINKIFTYLKLESITVEQEIIQNINNKYFLKWEEEKSSMSQNELNAIYVKFEERINNLGYSLKEV